VRPATVQTTALGAAYLAGLAVGYWESSDELAAHRIADRRFDPAMDDGRRGELIDGWRRAVERARSWA
jgi:glycerol kinase